MKRYIKSSTDANYILYRGVPTIFERDKLLNGEFRLNHNKELCFALNPGVSQIYGAYVVRVIVPKSRLNLIPKDTYSISERDGLINMGYDGVLHSAQIYLFNLDVLNNCNVNYVNVCDGIPCVASHTSLGLSKVNKSNTSFGIFYANSNAFDENCRPDSVITVQTLDEDAFSLDENLQGKIPRKIKIYDDKLILYAYEGALM